MAWDEAEQEYYDALDDDKAAERCEHCEGCEATALHPEDCERGCECGHEHEDEYDLHPPRV